MVPTDPRTTQGQATSLEVPAQAPDGMHDAALQPAGGPPAPPSVSLPKGGGAIRDIGEKFSVNAATGTASLAIPVATSPARAGFGPSLNLTYDSGAGNSPFGLGWKAHCRPSLARPTRDFRFTRTTLTRTPSS